MRGLFFKIIGFTLLMLITLGIGLHRTAAYFLHAVQWKYVEGALEIIAGLGLLFGAFFLIAPAASIIAGLYGEEIAGKVEAKHYPERRGKAIPVLTSLKEGVRIATISLGVNIIALIFLFTGIGIFILIFANAYLMSREYFEMAALRHLPSQEALNLRRANAGKVLFYGVPLGLLMSIPILNLITPLFGMTLMTHCFNGVRK